MLKGGYMQASAEKRGGKMLIGAYKKLWKERSAAESISSQRDLEEFIALELNDGLTHPRLRRPRTEKLDAAVSRIHQSELTAAEKTALEDLYRQVLRRLES